MRWVVVDANMTVDREISVTGTRVELLMPFDGCSMTTADAAGNTRQRVRMRKQLEVSCSPVVCSKS